MGRGEYSRRENDTLVSDESENLEVTLSKKLERRRRIEELEEERRLRIDGEFD